MIINALQLALVIEVRSLVEDQATSDHQYLAVGFSN